MFHWVGNKREYRKLSKGIKKFLKWFNILMIIGVAPFALPYLYTSPVLTERDIAIYAEFIEFAKHQSGYTNIELDDLGQLSLGNDIFMMDSPNPHLRKEEIESLAKFFAEEEIEKLINLSHKLGRTRCVFARKDGDMITFMQPALPMLTKKYGAIYSLSGRNPNDIDSNDLNPRKPFTEIGYGWYTSERLVNEVRHFPPVPFPKGRSLIDHSLKINRAALKKLDKELKETKTTISYEQSAANKL